MKPPARNILRLPRLLLLNLSLIGCACHPTLHLPHPPALATAEPGFVCTLTF